MSRVLIVDDDALLVDVLSELLDAVGFEVVVASSYDEAVERLAEHPNLELVLSDIDLRGERSGIDIIDHVRATRPELRAMLISGHSRSYLETVDPRIGDIELLSKPFRVNELLERIGPTDA